MSPGLILIALSGGCKQQNAYVLPPPKVVGGQIFIAFGLGLLLVCLCLAGQYDRSIAPLSVILAVPLSLVGPVIRKRVSAARTAA